MEKVLISAELHDKLIRLQSRCGYQSKLFLLGKNEYGVCTYLKALKKNGWSGCSFMPGISRNELAKAAVDIVKKNLSLGGFAYVSRNEHEEPGWGGDHGDDIYNYRDTPFVCFTGALVVAHILHGGYDVNRIAVAVVDKDFGKPKLPKTNRVKVKRTKPGSKRKK